MTKEGTVSWGIDSTRYHGPNVVRCENVTGLTQTLLVGVYLPPSTLEHLPDLDEALQRFRDPIFLGYLNVDLGKNEELAETARVLPPCTVWYNRGGPTLLTAP